MNVSFKQCSLYLCPVQADFTTTDLPSLISALQTTGLINNKINTVKSTNDYFTGEKFLDYIAYLGCAPAIKFEADKNNATYCFIRLHVFENAKLIHSHIQVKAPHCPQCKQPIKTWQQTKTTTQVICESCNTATNIKDLNWRKMAGYAQLFIEITDIFPKEAIPQQILLDKLAALSNVEWQYFYSCRDITQS